MATAGHHWSPDDLGVPQEYAYQLAAMRVEQAQDNNNIYQADCCDLENVLKSPSIHIDETQTD